MRSGDCHTVTKAVCAKYPRATPDDRVKTGCHSNGPNTVLLKWTDILEDPRSSHLCVMAVGSFMYAAIGTRLDVAFAVQNSSQFTQNPRPDHWVAIKRIFRQLNDTKDLGLTYGGKVLNQET